MWVSFSCWFFIVIEVRTKIAVDGELGDELREKMEKE
jgi:hypothetical protein